MCVCIYIYIYIHNSLKHEQNVFKEDTETVLKEYKMNQRHIQLIKQC